MKEITTEELKRLIDEKADFVLLDCRSVHYYNWEHIPQALNLRWKYVEKQASHVIPDKNTKIITYCDGFTCNASVRCFHNLQKAGYTNLIEYSGGLADWKANALETIEDTRFKIAANVYRFPKQQFAGEAVGSYLIEETDFKLLIDGPQQLTEEIEDFILHGKKPIKIFLSHGPTGGESGILQKKYGAEIFLHEKDRRNEWLEVIPNHFIQDGFTFNDHLTVIHTPGHSLGSAVAYDQKNKILFTGDHVQGDKEGNVYDFVAHDDGMSGDPKERLASTQKLLAYDFSQVLPFHYEMIRKNAKEAVQTFVNKHNA